jgi:hypothetical protein
VRKIVLLGLVVLAGACRHSTVEEPVSTGVRPVTAAGATPRSALDAYMAAIHSQDLQAMSLAWGDKNGPVRDSKTISRSEMEQREIYLMRCFRHDSFRVLGETQAADSERRMQVELARGTTRRVTDFYLAKGATRWYVRSATIEPVRETCSEK